LYNMQDLRLTRLEPIVWIVFQHKCTKPEANILFVGFDVITAVVTKNCLLGYNTMYTVESQRVFQRYVSPPSSVSNKPRKIQVWKQVNMEAVCSSETSVDFQRTARRYIPEGGTSHKISCRYIDILGLLTRLHWFHLSLCPLGVSHYSRVLEDPGDLIDVDQVSTQPVMIGGICVTCSRPIKLGRPSQDGWCRQGMQQAREGRGMRAWF
jgi:hypothetical protein